ncbi:hypothetical protein SERLADRAFT_344874 [Serpula lacrymans var. lacrymans S7.9]|nr:uncharacterized protein SERLADRAFT_344874 [Serpula lacrymans var. lacrymans S7.9]EGO31129.1 hypothetical protein SERLADRAFT_344874 [Serpula lacrymans var. lacrymans S7.9]
MYVDDRASLSRLSTLLESEETNLLSSPDINQSFDAFARIAMQQAEKNRRRQCDETSISNNPKSPQPQGPWYLRPSYSDELKADTDGQVKAGTLRALVEKLTIDPIRSHDLEFRKIFLLTFRSFVTAERLFDLLVERFEMRGPSNLSPQEIEEWKEKKLRPVQNRVLTVMTMWLEDYHLLDEEPEIAQKLTSFLSAIVMPSHLVLTAKLILQSLERMTFARPTSLSHQASLRRCRKPKSHKNDLLRWNPDELVEQLCLIEHKYYANIRPQECLNWAKLQTGEEVENITTFCHTHDQLSAWVKVSVLNSDVLGKRADVIDFWIRVADKCRNVHNFHSMSAVMAGLSSVVIARLHLTWSHCSRKSQYDALVKVCDPLNGSSGYKCLLTSTEGPCIPYVRTFLTDVIQIQGQYNDTIPLSASQGDVAFISFTKRQRWHETVTTMLRYQSKPYQFVVDPSARSFIEGVLYSSGTAGQDWFWSKSQEIQQSELAHADIRKGLEAAGF